MLGRSRPTTTLKEYFDPHSGRFQERVAHRSTSSRRTGTTVALPDGSNGKAFAASLAARIGKNSPLMKLE